MKETRFNNLLKGLSGSHLLDYNKRDKLFTAFAQNLLSGELTSSQIKQLYSKIPYEDDDGDDICLNKTMFFHKIGRENIGDKESKLVLDFIANVLKNEKEKAFLASFFVRLGENYEFTSLFAPIINEKNISIKTILIINDNTYDLKIEVLEFLYNLSKKADKEALKCIKEGFSNQRLKSKDLKNKHFRKLISELLLRLSSCKDDHFFSCANIFQVAYLNQNKSSDEDYSNLERRVANDFIKGDGDLYFVYKHFNDINYFISKLNQVKVEDEWIENSFKINGNINKTTFYNFANSNSDFSCKLTSLILCIINNQHIDKAKELLSIFLNNYYPNRKNGWKELIYFISNYDFSFGLKPFVIKVILQKILMRNNFSGKELEKINSLFQHLDDKQRIIISKHLSAINFNENYKAINKLYDVTTKFNVDINNYKPKIVETLELIKIADEF